MNRNRHERRRAAATSKTSPIALLAAHWPEVTLADVVGRRGQIVIGIFRHSDGCPTLHIGGGLLACQCSPTVSFHVEPTLQ